MDFTKASASYDKLLSAKHVATQQAWMCAPLWKSSPWGGVQGRIFQGGGAPFVVASEHFPDIAHLLFCSCAPFEAFECVDYVDCAKASVDCADCWFATAKDIAKP